METEALEYLDGNIESLLQILQGKVFHLTKQTSFQEIQKSGKICNNKDGRFGLNTSSGNSYGRRSGYVCFFDLRDKTEKTLKDILSCYYFLGPSWFMQDHGAYRETTLAYLILDPAHYNKLIPYEKAVKDFNRTSKWLQAIPHGEVWIADHVPITWISKAYFVRIRENVSPLARLINDAHHNLFKNS